MIACSVCGENCEAMTTRCPVCGYTHFSPTQEQIEARKRQIQDGWTANDERSRRGVSQEMERWYVPAMRHNPKGRHVYRGAKGDA